MTSVLQTNTHVLAYWRKEQVIKMASELDTYEKLCAIVNSKKFDKIAPYLLEKKNTVSAVKESTKVSRNTIYAYITPLSQMGYVGYGTPITKGQNIWIKSTLLLDYLSGSSLLNKEEKNLLARIFSEGIIRKIIFEQYGNSFSSVVQRSILCIMMLGADLEKVRGIIEKVHEADDFILEFGVANMLMLGQNQVGEFYSL